jgi:exopolysaccharide biosynthesis polyprenyl glycosylphosphotransferase
MLLAVRIILRLLVQHWKIQGRLLRSLAIVGGGVFGEELIERLKKEGKDEVEVIGIFDDRLTRISSSVGGYPVLGTTNSLIEYAQTSSIDEVIIALPLRATERIGEIVAKLRMLPVDLRLSIASVGSSFPTRGIGYIADIPLIEILDRPLKNWSGITKWLEDKILSILCIIIFSPLMAMIALAILLDSRGPIFFFQERFGFNNRSVRVIKFRTMYSDRGDPTGAMRTVVNDSRVTRVGRLLRRLSLDERPQLFNVLRGDMSLVGPRAHAVAMKAGDHLYHEAVDEYFQRHRVRPGITGWAQTHGSRGEINSVESAKRRVELDLY